MFPSSMSLGRKNGFLSRLVIAEAGKTNSWEDMFARMEQYKKREGHCNVPRSHKEDGANLGTWVPRQRIEKRKGELSADKSRRLESIGMVCGPLLSQWEDMFALLEAYKIREGHCRNVPRSYKEDGASLGSWVTRQRQAKKKEMLSADHKRRLEEFGILWEPLEAEWEETFAVLETYKIREGHCIVPQSHKEDGVNLVIWVKTQRETRSKGMLTVQKSCRLEDLGMLWEPLLSQREEMFAILETYVKREGHCDVPTSFKEDGASLGSWATRQRHAKKTGVLRADDSSYNFIGERKSKSKPSDWKQHFYFKLQRPRNQIRPF